MLDCATCQRDGAARTLKLTVSDPGGSAADARGVRLFAQGTTAPAEASPLLASAAIGMIREPATDRQGGDFAQFLMSKPDPQACLKACVANTQCQAFTYVKPGYQTEQAKCYLKRGGTTATDNAAAFSGRKVALQPERDPIGQERFCQMGLLCSVGQTSEWNPRQQACLCK